MNLRRTKFILQCKSGYFTIAFFQSIIFKYSQILGISLKEMLVHSGQVSTAITYLQEYTPSSKDGDWSGFLSKPSLPFVLKFLAGISKNHSNIQAMIGM